MKLLQKILDIIFPPKCAFCHEILTSKSPVCDECMRGLPFVTEPSCSRCGRPMGEFAYSSCNACRSKKKYFEHSFVSMVYKDKSKEAVLALKYGAHPYYSKAFAFLLANKILSSDKYTSFDYITCIPQSRKTHLSRGYNQSELIAKELARLLCLPFVPTLHRNNKGQRQATLLGRAERRKNVRLCYEKGSDTYNGETVLLVDDVYTTGETSNFCAKLLRQMGFKKVFLGICTIRDID